MATSHVVPCGHGGRAQPRRGKNKKVSSKSAKGALFSHIIKMSEGGTSWLVIMNKSLSDSEVHRLLLAQKHKIKGLFTNTPATRQSQVTIP